MVRENKKGHQICLGLNESHEVSWAIHLTLCKQTALSRPSMEKKTQLSRILGPDGHSPSRKFASTPSSCAVLEIEKQRALNID
jgi:hypothetical protein